MKKRCTKCGKEKPLEDFPVNRRMTTLGRDSWCLACKSEYNKGWRQRHPNRDAERRRACPEYFIWKDMTRRCRDKNRHDYHHYGGRGISVCAEWLGPGGFKRFLAYIGPRTSPKHSVDRFPNNDGNYEPGNVRWATQKEQTRNFCRTRLITVDGKTQCLSAWAEDMGVSPVLIHQRIGLLGWSERDAVLLPPGQRRAT